MVPPAYTCPACGNASPEHAWTHPAGSTIDPTERTMWVCPECGKRASSPPWEQDQDGLRTWREHHHGEPA